MQPRTYLNFDLSIRIDDSGGLDVSVLSSPAGEAQELHDWPFSDQDVEIFLLRVGHTRRGVRRIDSPEMEAARDFGARLYDTIFSGEIGESFERSIDEAERHGQGLRLRLHTDEFRKLSDIPWEFLYSSALHRFLTVSTATPLVRYIDKPRLIAPLEVDEAVRILTMVSSPTDLAQLDVENEWARINDSLGSLVKRGLIGIHRLPEATMGALQRELRQRTYHVFHFIGHGAFDKNSDQGVLMFEDDRRRGHQVSGEHLGTILHDHESLRLVVLNSCEGARSSPQDPFGGTAQGLVKQGIPAVIGMQFEITDDAAITFGHDFYAAIADGYPVDAALAEARKAIFTSGNDVEWGTPVLHMRTPDGRIFERVRSASPPEAIAPPRPAPLDDQSARLNEAEQALAGADYERAVAQLESVVLDYPEATDAIAKLAQARRSLRACRLYAGARVLLQAEQWQAVADRFGDIRALDPDFPDSDGLLATAEQALAHQERHSRLESLYQEAMTAISGGAWDEAMRLLTEIQAEVPEFRDVASLLEEATAHRDAARLVAAAQEAFDAEDWQAVVNRYDELRLLDPGDWSDSGDLESTARARLDEQERNRHLQARYDAAIGLIEEEKWDAALQIVDSIKAEQPDYPGIQKLQDTVRERATEQKGAESEERAAALFATTAAAVADKNWRGVIGILDQVDEIVPDYPGANALRERAERELQIIAARQEEGQSPAPDDTTTEPEPESPAVLPSEAKPAGRRRILLVIGGGVVIAAAIASVAVFGNDDSIPVARPVSTAANVAAVAETPEAAAPTPTTEPVPTTTASQAATTAPATTVPATAALITLQAPSQWNFVFSDTFTDGGGGWDQDSLNLEYLIGERAINGGVYEWEVSETTGRVWWDIAGPVVGDFYMEVDTRIVTGWAGHGVIFRVSGDRSSYYLFLVHPAGQFVVEKWADNQWETVVGWTESAAINVGATNRLSVLAEGPHLEFGINGALVAEANDSGLTSGFIGLAVSLTDGNTAVVQFDNADLFSPDEIVTTTAPVTPSWIAVLESLPTGEYTQAAAEDKLEAYRAASGIALDLLLSTDYSSLNPGYWVIYASGGWTDADAAAAFCASVSGSPDLPAGCYSRLLEY